MVTPTTPAPQHCRWHTFPSLAALEQAAVQAILNAARAAIVNRGAFRIVLAGGTTPRRVYELLRQTNVKETGADWCAWHVYFGDERCLPPEHPERNSRMAQQSWLNLVTIPPQQIHAIPAELGAQAAAEHYARELADVGTFDLVLLGLGEDGHTASLFPDHEWGTAAVAVLAVQDAPKPPPERVSLSAWRLSSTRAALFLVSGSSKQQAINAWHAGRRIPAAAITPPNGVDVYMDVGPGI